MAEHDLKVWPEYFEALWENLKPFEVRKNDRDYQVGDLLRLREYSPGPDEYTGRQVERLVTYVMNGDDPTSFAFGLRPGFVVLGLC